MQDSRNVHTHTRVAKQRGSVLTHLFRGFPFYLSVWQRVDVQQQHTMEGLLIDMHGLHSIWCVCACVDDFSRCYTGYDDTRAINGINSFSTTYKRSKNESYNYYFIIMRIKKRL